jgi:hypothetical protein
MMGNRGVLHDEAGSIRRAWQVKRWLICVLEFKGRHRTVMTPGRYTELFFLDEATALAAGHRPCAECQRARFNEFRDAWAIGNSVSGVSRRPAANDLDERLHAERVGPARSKRTTVAALDDLPDGVFVLDSARTDQPLLLVGDSLLVWLPGGYRHRLPRIEGETVTVLTPESTVSAIRAGFHPRVHPSAQLT